MDPPSGQLALPVQELSMLVALPAPILVHVFTSVSGKDCVSLCCSCSTFLKILSAEPGIWAKCCEAEFCLSPDDVDAEAAALSAASPASRSSSSGQSTAGREFQAALGRSSGEASRSGEGRGGEAETGEEQVEAQRRTRLVREVYRSHFMRGKKYPETYGRAVHLWSPLLKWTQSHIPTLSRSVLPGASELELDAAERTLGLTFPPAFRALYIVHNGQLTPYDALITASEEAADIGLRCPVGAGSVRPNASPSPQEIYHTCFHGLLGSYSFYDHAVSTRLLPVQLAVLWTKKIRQYLSRHREGRQAASRSAQQAQAASDGGGGQGCSTDGWAHRVLLAASFMKIQRGFHFTKMFFLDCQDGNVYVGGSDLLAGGALLRCSPPPPRGLEGSGLLTWLEEYVRRLDSGMYQVREIQEDYPFKGISLFPELPPLCSDAVSRRVRVRASALFVPEALPLGPPLPANPLARGDADLQGEERVEPSQSCYAYSVRLSLLSVEEASERAPESELGDLEMKTCQLHRRHWLIEEGGVQAVDVRGEAVVGKYPLLRQGEEEFVYQSCTQMGAETGSIEGDFTFVPGSMETPEGPEFEAAVAKFHLRVPDFIF